MKLRYFSLIPLLLLVSCTNNEHSNKLDNGAYYNVYYDYVQKEHCYYVYLDKNETNGHCYKVPPKNVYFVPTTIYVEEVIYVENEYFVSTNELFVYTK